MIGFAADDTRNSTDGYEDVSESVSEDTLRDLHARDEDAVWVSTARPVNIRDLDFTDYSPSIKISVEGTDLANVTFELPKYPGMTLVMVGDGETLGRKEEPIYVARGWHRVSSRTATLHISLLNSHSLIGINRYTMDDLSASIFRLIERLRSPGVLRSTP